MSNSWAATVGKQLKTAREKESSDAARFLQNRALITVNARDIWISLCETMQRNAAEVNSIEQHFTMKNFDVESDEYLIASSKGHVIVHFDGGPSVRYRFVPKDDPLTENPKLRGAFQFGVLNNEVLLEHPERGLMRTERAAEYLLDMLVPKQNV